MRARLASLVLVALAAAPAGAQRETGWTGIVLKTDDSTATVAHVDPAVRGVYPGDRVLAVDGRPVCPRVRRCVDLALEGPPGTEVSVTLAAPGGAPRTVRLTRWEHSAPGPGYTAVRVTPHFVVRTFPTPAGRRFGARLARRAEALWRRAGLPADVGGRRLHVYGGDDPNTTSTVHGPWRVSVTVGDEDDLEGAFDHLLGEVVFGPGGDPVEAMLGGGWTHPRERLRRAGAEALLRGGQRPGLAFALTQDGVPASASLREYVRGRWGDARLAALWRSEDAFETAVPRVLGISAERLVADWRRDVFRLGPDPRERVAPATVALTLGWGALVLLWGVRTARRREVE